MDTETNEIENTNSKTVKTLCFSTVSQRERHSVQRDMYTLHKETNRVINKVSLRLPTTTATINGYLPLQSPPEKKIDSSGRLKNSVLESIQETNLEENKPCNKNGKLKIAHHTKDRISILPRYRRMSIDSSKKASNANVMNEKQRTSSAIIFESRKSRRDSVVTKLVRGNAESSAPVRKTSIVSKPIRAKKTSISIIERDKEAQSIEESKLVKLTIEIPVFTQNVGGNSRYVTYFKNVKGALMNNDSEISSIIIVHDASDQLLLHDQNSSPIREGEILPSENVTAVQGFLRRILDDLSRTDQDEDEMILGYRQLYECIKTNPQETVDVLCNVVQTLIQAIQQHDQDMATFQCSVEALDKLTDVSDSTCFHICQESGIPPLLRALENCQESGELLLSLLHILERMSEIENTKDSLLEHSCQRHVLTTLSRHDEDVETCALCLSIVSNLIQSVEAAKSLLYIGGIYVIIRVTKTLQSHSQIQENACRVIGTFSSHDELGLDVANAGCLHLVLDIFCQLFTSSAEVSQSDSLIECLLYAIACLSKYEETSKELSSSNIFQKRLVSVMTEHIQNEALQEYGTWIICNMAEYGCLDQPPVSTIMGLLMQILDTFPDNRNLMHEVLVGVNTIISTPDIFSDGSIGDGISGELLKRVFQLMENLKEEEIQELGCAFVCYIAVNEKEREALLEAGASKVLASNMMKYTGNARLQEYGAIGLMNMTANVVPSKTQVIHDGGIQSLLSAIQYSIDNPDLILYSLKALGNLLEIDEGCFVLLDNGGLQQMSNIVKMYEGHTEMSSFVCEVLLHIASTSGVDERFIHEAESILKTLHIGNCNDENIILRFCQFYGRLSTNETYFHRFVKAKGLCFLIQLAGRYHDNMEMQLIVCETVASHHMYTKTKTISKEDMIFIIQSMRAFPTDVDIQTVCFAAITYMSEHSNSNKLYLINSAVLPDIIHSMTQFHDVIRLQIVGLMALDHLISIAKKSDIDDVTAFMMAILDTMTACTDNSDIQFYCCRIITRLQSIDCVQSSKDHLLVPLVDILRRRRSTGEAKSSARQALQTILTDEKEYRDLMESHDLNCEAFVP